jgi:hypothetical protein
MVRTEIKLHMLAPKNPLMARYGIPILPEFTFYRDPSFHSRNGQREPKEQIKKKQLMPCVRQG